MGTTRFRHFSAFFSAASSVSLFKMLNWMCQSSWFLVGSGASYLLAQLRRDGHRTMLMNLAK